MPRGADANDGGQLERLSESINHLAEQVEVLREAIDEVRELYRWALDNRQDASPVQGAILRRMARDPCDPHWSDRLEIVRYCPPAEVNEPAGVPTDDASLDLATESIQQLTDQTEAITHGLRDVSRQAELSLDALRSPPSSSKTASAAREGKSQSTLFSETDGGDGI